MAELVEQYSIRESGPLADVLDGFTTVGKTERGKLYGERDGELVEIGRTAADVLFTFGENSGELVKIEPVPEDDNEMLLQHIQALKAQLALERAEHAAEIRDLNRQHKKEMDKLRGDIATLRDSLSALRNQLRENGIIAQEVEDEVEGPLQMISQPEQPEAEPPEPSLLPGQSPERVIVNADPEVGDKGGIWNGSEQIGSYEIIRVERDQDGRVDGLWVVQEGEPKDMDHARRIYPQAWRQAGESKVTKTEVVSTASMPPRRPTVFVEEEHGRTPSPPPEQRSSGRVLAGVALLGAIAALGVGIFAAVEAEDAEHKPDKDAAKIVMLEDKDASLQTQINRLRQRVKSDEQHDKSTYATKAGLKKLGVKVSTLEIGERFEPKAFGSTNTGNIGADYPWTYYAGVYGPNRAETEIQILGRRAMAAGHVVRWSTGGYLPDGERAQIVSVDGHYDTPYVVKVLNSFR